MSLNNPYACLPEVPTFTVTSTSVGEGQLWAAPQLSAIYGMPGGADRSPELSWSGAPADTKSFVVTVYDADATTGSGFWHWAVANIPAATTSLPEGAGDPSGSGLPPGTFHVPNDARLAQYVGAAPPAGGGPHRYFITVSALDVADIGVAPDSTPAILGLNVAGHILARGTLHVTGETPAA